MAIKVQIPTPMRQHTEGKTEVEVSGGTVQAALADLSAKYPAIAERVFQSGKVRPFINLYVNNEDVRYLDNLATPVKDGDELAIIPAVAGG
ncbi:MAG TPA: ubiquitin-like small modifier protein 1 [Gemmataceae bacterium]|nr:ubiquitin-like small modifier protein 1 [Gemmataceae bacterium]